jgi:protease I
VRICSPDDLEGIVSKRILIITGDGGESYETWFAVHRFQEAGYDTHVAAPSKRRLHLVMHDFEPGWDTYKESPGYAIDADLTFDEVKPASYDGVVCIGGRAPEYLRNDPRVIAILQEIDAQGKWIFSICHGVQLVAAAGLAKGKRFTCYEHVKVEVEAVGGRFVKTDVVRDGRLVSSPTWREHPAFYREVFACLEQPVTA